MNITIGKPWAVSEKGGRLNNEDSIFPLPETANSNQNLFLVCDGVGGAEKGEIASSLACESFQTWKKNSVGFNTIQYTSMNYIGKKNTLKNQS